MSVISPKKLDIILKYLKYQRAEDLSLLKTPPTKTKEEFLKNYELHDEATRKIVLQYFQANFSVHPIGKDLRNDPSRILNETPDYFLEKIVDVARPADQISFCIDVKAKSSPAYFGWVNVRSMDAYKTFSQTCDISVYIVFILVIRDQPLDLFGYIDLRHNPIAYTRAWDGNKVAIYDWQLGLPHIIDRAS